MKRNAVYFGLAQGAVFLGASWAFACNIPVFRYALERWRPDPYEILIFHDQPLAGADKALVQALEDYADEADCPSNIVIARVNLEGKISKEHQRLYRDVLKQPRLPCLVVRFPESTELTVPIYVGPLSWEAVLGVLDSPVRRQLVQRLVRGDATVWLLLESGDKKQDDAALARLCFSLTRLQPGLAYGSTAAACVGLGGKGPLTAAWAVSPTVLQPLTLPELTKSPKDQLRRPDGPPVQIAFSILRVRRDDPREPFLMKMLLNIEEDLEPRREPMVFPIFGQGIALWALVGAGITDENIERSARFLVGACSCEVKKANPGVDLLVTADWNEGLSNPGVSTPDPLPRLLNLSSAQRSATKTGPLPQDKPASRSSTQDVPPPTSLVSEDETGTALPLDSQAAVANPRGSSLLHNLGVVGIVGLSIVLAATLVILVRNKKPEA